MKVDACGSLVVARPFNGQYLASSSAVEQCYNSFPVTVESKTAQVEALKSHFSLYPYTDIVEYSSFPFYSIEYNFMENLDFITTNEAIATEYQLQTAIKAAINKLEDGHVNYSPLCFQSWRFYQPFQIEPNFAGDDVNFFVGGLTLASNHSAYNYSLWAKEFLKFSPQEFIGAKVLAINGEDPVDFMQSFADKNNGIAHSPEGRFNTLFSTYNYPIINKPFFNSLVIQRIAHEPFAYRFEMLGGLECNATFEWVAQLKTNPKNFESAASYYNAECKTDRIATSTAVIQPRRHIIGRTGFEIVEDESDSDKAGKAEVWVDGAKLLQGDTNGAFFIMSDGITGVWMMSSFAPADESDVGLSKWLKSMADGLSGLQANGVKRLIIDLTNNGGGYVCVGWLLANHLFPNANLKSHEFSIKMTQPLADVLISNGHIAQELTGNGKTLNGTVINDALNQLIVPGNHIGVYHHLFSNKFTMQDDCPAIPKSNFTGFPPKSTVLVSNGVCGSTCAQFVTYLRDQVGVRAVTYGGGRKRSDEAKPNFDPTAFAAGYVLPFDSVRQIFAVGNLTIFDPANERVTVADQDDLDSTRPSNFVFPINEGSQMPFATSFSIKPFLPFLPIEWIVHPSEFYLEIAELGNPVSVWNVTLEKLGW